MEKLWRQSNPPPDSREGLMFCPKCGAQVPDGTKFCPACGTPLNPAAPMGGPASAPDASGPVVTPVSPAAGDKAAMARLVRLVAAVVMIAGCFLPTVSLAGIVDMSALQMTFGLDVFGQHMPGDLTNLVFFVPGIVALLAALLAKGKAGSVLAVVCGVFALGVVALWSFGVSNSLGGYISPRLAIGGWLYVISGIASIVGGVLELIKK